MLSRIHLSLAFAALVPLAVSAQSARGVAEATIGGKSVDVEYGRPNLRGRDMLGKAPVGTVWRTGADTATTFTTEADILAGDEPIPAGAYSLFTKRVDETTWHLVFNTQTGQWGTSYDSSLDLTEVPLTWTQSGSSVEQFTIELTDAGELKLLWGAHVLALELRAR